MGEIDVGESWSRLPACGVQEISPESVSKCIYLKGERERTRE